jgi:pSer/pThr/pTyr-binding forkhead associated (FHA) protein
MSGVLLLALRLGLAVALYAFLGWSLWLLWRDLRQQSQAAMAVHLPALTLVQQGVSPERTWRFTLPQVIVGRDPGCHCRLEDGAISARHARLSYHHSQWWVEDLQSRNGTFLNESPVKEPIVVISGDQLLFGAIAFQVMMDQTE